MNKNDAFNPDTLEDEAVKRKLLLDTAVDIQVVLHILIDAGITTSEEINMMREKVKSLPKYKASYASIANLLKANDLYKNDPQEYLKQMLKAKMDGKL